MCMSLAKSHDDNTLQSVLAVQFGSCWVVAGGFLEQGIDLSAAIKDACNKN